MSRVKAHNEGACSHKEVKEGSSVDDIDILGEGEGSSFSMTPTTSGAASVSPPTTVRDQDCNKEDDQNKNEDHGHTRHVILMIMMKKMMIIRTAMSPTAKTTAKDLDEPLEHIARVEDPKDRSDEETKVAQRDHDRFRSGKQRDAEKNNQKKDNDQAIAKLD